MSNEPEPRLIVYKAFGIPTDNGVFDDVKSGSLWPGNPPNFPRISKVVVWAPSGPGANGINGISVTYQLGPSGPDRVVENGEQSGTNYVVDIPYGDIVEVIATVDKETNKIYDLTFILDDNSPPHGPFPGDSLPPDVKKDVSARGFAVGFYGSLCSEGHISSLGVYARDLPK